ncbi:MAG: hypothetical protein Q7U86_09565 [Draconibacterium sp.]|nr:hypothetical protein [Draconibacterium sp.]
MNIDKLKLRIHKIGVEEIPVLVEYRLAYLAELQGEIDESNKNQLKNELELYFRKSLEEGRFVAFCAETKGKILSFGVMIIQFILILSLF